MLDVDVMTPRRRWARRFRLAMVGGGLLLTGCVGSGVVNPSFDVTRPQAQQLLVEMADDPRPLTRPLLILGGYLDPGLNRAHLDADLADVIDDDRWVAVSFPPFVIDDFDEARDLALQAVSDAFGDPDDPDWTVEVDVIGVSMGGLVARYAASPPPPEVSPAPPEVFPAPPEVFPPRLGSFPEKPPREGKETSGGGGQKLPGERRLKIARLFTIATPHQGARMARWVHPGSLAGDMRPGSAFLERLDAALPEARYTTIPYARLGDWTVGAANSAPPGQTPWWVGSVLFGRNHADAHKDPRIVADIARRLREEPPLTTAPPAPFPE